MSNTPEGRVKNAVKKVLKDYGVYYFMPVQTGYGAPSLDILCCYKGHFLAIETKAPGKKPTERQKLTIAQMEQAGAKVFVIDGETGELKRWLDFLSAQ